MRDRLVLLILVFCFFLHFFQDHHTLDSTRIEIALRDLLVDQILMAVNAGGALGFHLLVRGLRRCARWLGILVTFAARDAVPVFQRHARVVGHDGPALVKFLDR